jgi:hypothetical protein
MATVYETELDSRQRLPMARIIHGDAKRFRVTALDSGDYLLTPVVSMSERELEILSNPERVASIKEGIRQAANEEVTRYPAGHFSKLAAELGDD